jgi:uncharacterized protein
MVNVKESKLHNMGLFTDIGIKRGTRIIEYIGEKINAEESERREEENLKKGTTYLFILDDEHCIDGEIYGNESKYINHSCEPNCDVDITDGRIFIFAARDIKPDEELTLDYAFPHDDIVRNVCNCGSAKCRGFLQEPEPELVA